MSLVWSIQYRHLVMQVSGFSVNGLWYVTSKMRTYYRFDIRVKDAKFVPSGYVMIFNGTETFLYPCACILLCSSPFIYIITGLVD